MIERMLASTNATVAQVGARLVCVTAFAVPQAEPLAERTVVGHIPLRLGAAEVYSANLLSGPDRRKCSAALQCLFRDPESDVRSASVHFVYDVSPDDLPIIEPLMQALISSSAFAESGGSLFHLLEKTHGHMPALLLAAVERFLATSGRDAADASTGAAATASEAADLLIRAYSQSEDEDIRRRCLDLIDGLLEQEAFGIDRALETLSRS